MVPTGKWVLTDHWRNIAIAFTTPSGAPSGRRGLGSTLTLFPLAAGIKSVFLQAILPFPKTVYYFIVVVLPLARFTAYFLHVNMAKYNNRI